MYRVLEMSGGIDDLRGIQWDAFYSLLAAWILEFLCLFQGIKTSGKVI